MSIARLMRRLIAGVSVGAMSALVAAQTVPSYNWDLPVGFPRPRVPSDNPMTAAKIEAGRYLFYDQRLSGNGQQSCATCHEQARAFTDGKPRAVGSTGEVHPRNSMSLANVAYAAALTWGNPAVTRLEDQALVPMFGAHPVELGLTFAETALLSRLRQVNSYHQLLGAAFPNDDDPFTLTNVTRALASFERSIISGRSAYDRYHFERDEDALTPAAKRGERLFFSQPRSCFRCHNGFNFSSASDFEGREASEVEFFNTGLYNLAGQFSYPTPNRGIYEVTTRPEDVGKFKAPTLRNVAVSAPYMHDGSIATLEEVIDHYAAGRPQPCIRTSPGRRSKQPQQERGCGRFHHHGRGEARSDRVSPIVDRRGAVAQSTVGQPMEGIR